MATSQTTPAAPPQEEEEEEEEERASPHECEQFLSLLPREDRYDLYQYQGFWYSRWSMLAMLSCGRHFQARNTDIILATSPKSGTTWLKALAFAIVNRTVYPDPQHHPLLTNNPHDLVRYLEIDLYADNQIPHLNSMRSPTLVATHLPYMALPESIKDDCNNSKIIYLCRNPKDVVASYWHFFSKSTAPMSLEETFEMFCAGVSSFGPFWDHVLGYWKASLERTHKVLFLKYEDLKREPMALLERMASFLGYPFTPKEYDEEVPQDILRLCSFENLSNLEVNKTGKLIHGNRHILINNSTFFRRGEVGDSRNHLTTQMIEQLDQITEAKLQGSGLTFEVFV